MVDFEEIGDCGSELLWKESQSWDFGYDEEVKARVDVRAEAMLGKNYATDGEIMSCCESGK